MSDYKDYDSGARGYDRQREAFGVDQILQNILALSGKSKSEIHVLDAGCGTGNYSAALLDAGIGKVSMFDASSGMLQLAANKVNKYKAEGRVGEIKQGVFPTIPFEDGSFDVVMINMVLHHLKADSHEEKTKVISAVFGETARVINQGGVFLSTTCFPEQYVGFWYANLVPEVTHRVADRFRSRDSLAKMLTENGFSRVDFLKLLGHEWALNYLDHEGPLKPEWRNIDSYWALFTDEELQAAIERAEGMKVAGTLHQFMLDNDKSMTEGNIVLVTAVKQ